MTDEKRFTNKKLIAVSITLLLFIGVTGVLGFTLVDVLNDNTTLSRDYNNLYVDYLELLNDFNTLDNQYFILTGEHIELENDYKSLLDDYNILLEAYNNLLSEYNTLLEVYNTVLDNLILNQIETFCNADTYVNTSNPNGNYGNEQYWYVGFDDYTFDIYTAFFNFSVLDKPETYGKVELQIYYQMFYSEGTVVPYRFFQEWDEYTLTYNNISTIDPDYISFSINYDIAGYSSSMTIDVTEWINTGVDSISIVLAGYEKVVGYTREHPNQDFVPKLIWTIIETTV